MMVGASLVALIGCATSDGNKEDRVPCSSNDNVAYLMCKDKNGTYDCTAPKNIPDGGNRADYCSCYCNVPSKEPIDHP